MADRRPWAAPLRAARLRAGWLGAGRSRAGRSPGRWPSGRSMLFAGVLAAIVAAMAWAVLGSRLLVVRSVRVVGAGRAVPVAQVLTAAQVQMGLPLIRVDAGAAARRLERLRQVQSARVSKNWPSTIVITVRPRVPLFAVRAAGRYALVDRFGVSVRTVAARPAGLPLLATPGAGTPLRGNPAERAAAVVLGELPPRVAGEVTGVSAASPTDVSVTLANGAVVVWGDTAHGPVKAKELTLLMRHPARTYDVSAPGTAMTSG